MKKQQSNSATVVFNAHHQSDALRQTKRRVFQTGFFILFIIAPIFNLLRLDLNLGHFIFFGMNWTLGLEAFTAGEGSSLSAVTNLILRGFLPIVAIVGVLGWVAWKYGRLYCGWLCPHFSVVETINSLMRRASGKSSFWDKSVSSMRIPSGGSTKVNRLYWIVVYTAVAVFSFTWAVVLLTYLLPPAEIYSNLIHLSLTRNQMVFIAVATFLFTIEFTFARHLFCRFACAVGVFQSFLWMANKKAMVVSFNRKNAKQCQDCYNACDDVCPMRLKPRSIKRHMFTCTECGQCLSACEDVQAQFDKPTVLQWKNGQDALQESDR